MTMNFRLSILLLIVLSESCFACIEPRHDTTHPNLVSWSPNATVAVANDTVNPVPFTLVQNAVDNWSNQLASLAPCSVTFTTGAGSGQVINIKYGPIPVDPQNPSKVTRGLTNYNDASYLNSRLESVPITINTAVTDPTAIMEVIAHEIGHTVALLDCVRCGLHSTVMESGDIVTSVNDSIGTPGPTGCDIFSILSALPDYQCPPPPGGGGGGECDQFVGGDDFAPLQTCGDTSPIIIDTEGQGFHLTSATNGVLFDIRGDGHPVQMAWTAPGSHNAFLALDRNGDGKVSSGKELFGNFTPQPSSNHPNGFLALKEFDKPENGGNGDNVIDERDQVYSKLRLWIDENHDGIAQPNELHALPELGVYAISLDYKESRRRDDFGNQFRYKAKINPSGGRRDERDERSEAGRWTYDVFLATTNK